MDIKAYKVISIHRLTGGRNVKKDIEVSRSKSISITSSGLVYRAAVTRFYSQGLHKQVLNKLHNKTCLCVCMRVYIYLGERERETGILIDKLRTIISLSLSVARALCVSARPLLPAVLTSILMTVTVKNPNDSNGSSVI